MSWRIIGLDTYNAYLNMAIDESISDVVRQGKSEPTIRFYKWQPSAVSIGCFQSMKDEVNIDRCNELGIDYVRRRTGGGAVYHDEKGEITYSVIAPLSYFPKGIHDSYKVICGWVISGLANAGIDSSFAPINDIIVNGKKISGNAQTRRDGILLQHGTILYDLDIKTMFSVLNVSKEKISDKMIKNVEERVTKVLDYKDISQEELYKSLLYGFTKDKEYEMGPISVEEERRAKDLAKKVYESKEWNFSR